MRTQVVIVGAGPAGLLLSHLLGLEGIDSVLVERQTAEYVQARIRAGILEAGTVELLRQAGLGARLDVEGMEHRGIHLQWPGNRHHVDFTDLIGRSVTVYGQTEVTKDLMAAREKAGRPAYYSAADVTLHDVDRNPVRDLCGRRGRRAADRCGCRRGLRRVPRAEPVGGARPAGLGAGVPVRVAGGAGRRPAVDGRADLRLAPGRVRDAQHAFAAGEPVLPAGDPGRGHRTVERRPDLDGAVGPARRPGVDAGDRDDHGEERAPDAELRDHPDAARKPLPGRGCRAHRATDRCERAEPGGGGRRPAGDGVDGVVPRRRPARGRVLGDGVAAGLAVHALLVVDDVDAAPPRRRLRRPAPAFPAPPHGRVRSRR